MDVGQAVNDKIEEVKQAAEGTVKAADGIGDNLLAGASASKYTLGVVVAYSLVMFAAGILVGLVIHLF
jgi:hypothetical protein